VNSLCGITSRSAKTCENVTQFHPLQKEGREGIPRNRVARIEPINPHTAQDSAPLSSPKGGEGWGEEASGHMGKFHWVFNVRYLKLPGSWGGGRKLHQFKRVQIHRLFLSGNLFGNHSRNFFHLSLLLNHRFACLNVQHPRFWFGKPKLGVTNFKRHP
jgi:hypothetical protein